MCVLGYDTYVYPSENTWSQVPRSDPQRSCEKEWGTGDVAPHTCGARSLGGENAARWVQPEIRVERGYHVCAGLCQPWARAPRRGSDRRGRSALCWPNSRARGT